MHDSLICAKQLKASVTKHHGAIVSVTQQWLFIVSITIQLCLLEYYSDSQQFRQQQNNETKKLMLKLRRQTIKWLLALEIAYSSFIFSKKIGHFSLDCIFLRYWLQSYKFISPFGRSQSATFKEWLWSANFNE